MDYRYRSYARLTAPTPVMPIATGLGVVESGGEAIYPRHRHQDFELLLPWHGIYRCRVNGIPLTVPVGQALLVKPGDWHEDLLAPAGRHLGLWFRLALAGEDGHSPSLPLFADGAQPEQQLITWEVAPVLSLIDALLTEFRTPDALSPGVQQGLVEVLFWRAVRGLDPAAISPSFLRHQEARTFPARLHAVFRRHEGAPLEVTAMAAALAMSPRGLTTACRTHLGTSPARAWTAWRLDRAAELLTRTDLSVGAVSQRLGFANPFHFARAYRRQHGHPPSGERAGMGRKRE